MDEIARIDPDKVRDRVAKVLGWTPEEARQFSLQMLREMMRGKSWKLAHELTLLIEQGIVTSKPEQSKRRERYWHPQ